MTMDMDPTVALESARLYARKLNGESDLGQLSDREAASNGYELAETFRDLDGWITAGGFLPRPWMPPLAATSPGVFEDASRAEVRLAGVFDLALKDDETWDKRLALLCNEMGCDTAERQQVRNELCRLLAREVIAEMDRERQHIEAMLRSTVTQVFLDNLRKELERTDHPQGFTPEGWKRLNDKGGRT